jgi:hypothetical protein
METSTVAGERATLARLGRRLEYFTIAWNNVEGLVAIGAGAVAGSISLVGFGVDSFIEVTSGAALIWRMSPESAHCHESLWPRMRCRGSSLESPDRSLFTAGARFRSLLC